MPPPAHVSVIRHVSHDGIADVSLTRPDPVLPASDLIVVSILTRAQGVFLLPCGTVTRNIVTKSSTSGASAAVLLGRVFAVTGFHSASAKVLQSRPAPGLCTTCLPAMVTFSPIVVFHFLRRFLPCILAMLALVHALRLHTDLHWHKIAINVLLCSRELEVLLSHLYTARDSCAFPDETSFDSLVLPFSAHSHPS